MNPRLRKVLDRVGAVLVVLVALALGLAVFWNVFLMETYGSECSWNGGCRSFLCMRHGLRGDEQVSSSGRCTKECSDDASCGDGYRCVTLGSGARDDLPPFGKPSRACLRVLEPAAAPP